jgi:hypothetical protein
MEKEGVTEYPEVTFIYTRHASSSDAECVWDIAEDADIILFETVGSSPDQRTSKEAEIAAATQEKDLYRRNSMVEKIVHSRSPFGKRICINAALDGKELRFIDVDSTWSGGAWEKSSEVLDKSFRIAKKEGEFLLSFEFFRASVFEKALWIFERDLFVSKQVKELIDANQERWRGKKIAVIQGTFHSKTYDTFKKDYSEIPSMLVFSNVDPFFSLYYEAENCIISGNRAEAEALIKKLYLSTCIIRPATGKLIRFVADETLSRVSDTIASSLSDGEVTKVFSDLVKSSMKIRKRFKKDDNRSKALRKNHFASEASRIGKNIVMDKRDLIDIRMKSSLLKAIP